MKFLLASPVIALLIGGTVYACTPKVDLCKNIRGYQKQVPTDLVVFEGDCVAPPDDAPPPIETPPPVIDTPPAVVAPAPPVTPVVTPPVVQGFTGK